MLVVFILDHHRDDMGYGWQDQLVTHVLTT
jgi:hypothetical protein